MSFTAARKYKVIELAGIEELKGSTVSEMLVWDWQKKI